MFRRTDKTGLELNLLLPGNWAKAWLGSCKWLQAKFKQTGARFVIKTEKAQRDAQEKAARAILQIEKQYGGVISHLHRIMGLEGLLELVERCSNDDELAGLTAEDSERIEAIVSRLKLEKPHPR